MSIMLKPIVKKEAIQIEITNACIRQCSNCTRLVGHHAKPYMMSFDYFKTALDSIDKTPTLIGIMGGEPMLHPKFIDICLYLQKKFPPEKLGLWSTLDKRFKKYAPIISDTFGAVLPNNHTHKKIFHSPILVCSKKILGDNHITAVENCWIQNNWSASINPHGAYFCEVAAAIDMLLKTKTAFDINTSWWRKKPSACLKQVKALCSRCGVCLDLTPRKDTEKIDDLDKWWLKKLKNKSPKLMAERCQEFTGCIFDHKLNNVNSFRSDLKYFHKIAKEFGLKLTIQGNGYLKPCLSNK
jgi:organic radical activating enzyme